MLAYRRTRESMRRCRYVWKQANGSGDCFKGLLSCVSHRSKALDGVVAGHRPYQIDQFAFGDLQVDSLTPQNCMAPGDSTATDGAIIAS